MGHAFVASLSSGRHSVDDGTFGSRTQGPRREVRTAVRPGAQFKKNKGPWRTKSLPWSSLGAPWVKDLALLLLWLLWGKFDPWPGNFGMLRVQSNKHTYHPHVEPLSLGVGNS